MDHKSRYSKCKECKYSVVSFPYVNTAYTSKIGAAQSFEVKGATVLICILKLNAVIPNISA